MALYGHACISVPSMEQVAAALRDACLSLWCVQDLAQEAAAVAAAFRLPWNAAASWMAQQGPELAPAACPPGGTPGSSDVTGEYQTRPPVSEVLGPQHDDACRAPGGAACRSLLRGAADPRQHARYMAAAYRGCNPAQQECEPAAQQAARPGGQLASHGAHPSGAAAASDSSSAGSSATGASEAASLDGGDAAELAEEEERLLAEASSTFSGWACRWLACINWPAMMRFLAGWANSAPCLPPPASPALPAVQSRPARVLSTRPGRAGPSSSCRLPQPAQAWPWRRGEQ